MAVDPNELIQLLRSNPAVREAVFAIASEVLPRGAVVRTVNDVPLKGFTAVNGPFKNWRKD